MDLVIILGFGILATFTLLGMFAIDSHLETKEVERYESRNKRQ